MLVLWLTIAFCAVIIAVLSMIYFDHAVIFGSALGGAYCFMRGISEYAGSYPNEFMLYKQLANDTVGDITWSFYVYFSAMVILTVVSTIF